MIHFMIPLLLDIIINVKHLKKNMKKRQQLNKFAVNLDFMVVFY